MALTAPITKSKRPATFPTDANSALQQEAWIEKPRWAAHTLVQLKKKLNATSELVNFDVGWLAREDKPEMIPDEKTFRVQLK